MITRGIACDGTRWLNWLRSSRAISWTSPCNTVFGRIFSLAQFLLEGKERRTMLSFSRGLWRHQNFMLLWAGQTVSLFGTQITMLALPTIAILLLHATPFEVGVLAAIPWAAYLGLGLF